MRIIVCVKQVPDTTEVKIDPETNTLIREGVPSILNPYDQFALEESVRLRELMKEKGVEEPIEILVLSMGPPQARSALLKCLALGADRAVLLTDRKFAGADTYATSYTLSKAIEKLGAYELIFCGQQAIDGDTAQVGPELAQHLRLPQVTYVERVEDVELTKAGKLKSLLVKKQVEDGYAFIEVRLPALLAGIPPTSFEPTAPPFKGIMGAKRKPFEVWGVEELEGDPAAYGLEGSLTQVIKTYPPPVRERGTIIEGVEAEEAVKKLLEHLKDDEVMARALQR